VPTRRWLSAPRLSRSLEYIVGVFDYLDGIDVSARGNGGSDELFKVIAATW